MDGRRPLSPTLMADLANLLGMLTMSSMCYQMAIFPVIQHSRPAISPWRSKCELSREIVVDSHCVTRRAQHTPIPFKFVRTGLTNCIALTVFLLAKRCNQVLMGQLILD